MHTIFISGIPKGLDRKSVSRRIEEGIESVAQVQKIRIQKEKGYASVTLQDETSVDFALSLNEKIYINGKALRIMRWKTKHQTPKTPRETTEETCKKQVYKDVFVFRGYSTYTDYQSHRPQVDVLFQRTQQTPKERKPKRKPWKNVNRLSNVPSPKSRKAVRAQRQKRKKKNSHRLKAKTSTSSIEKGLHKTSSRQTRLFDSTCAVDKLLEDPICTKKAFIPEKEPGLEIETTKIHEKPLVLTQAQPSATVHVYDHSKRLCSIVVDNNNVLESINTELGKNRILPSNERILILHNGKTVNSQWQPKMANDDNIHVTVTGKGGMMQGDHLDTKDKEDDIQEHKIIDRGNLGAVALVTEADGVDMYSEPEQQIPANLTPNPRITDEEINTCDSGSTADEFINIFEERQLIPAEETTVDLTAGKQKTKTGTVEPEEFIDKSGKVERMQSDYLDNEGGVSEQAISNRKDFLEKGTAYGEKNDVQSDQNQPISSKITTICLTEALSLTNFAGTRCLSDESVNQPDPNQHVQADMITMNLTEVTGASDTDNNGAILKTEEVCNQSEQKQHSPAQEATKSLAKSNEEKCPVDTGSNKDEYANEYEEKQLIPAEETTVDLTAGKQKTKTGTMEPGEFIDKSDQNQPISSKITTICLTKALSLTNFAGTRCLSDESVNQPDHNQQVQADMITMNLTEVAGASDTDNNGTKLKTEEVFNQSEQTSLTPPSPIHLNKGNEITITDTAGTHAYTSSIQFELNQPIPAKVTIIDLTEGSGIRMTDGEGSHAFETFNRSEPDQHIPDKVAIVDLTEGDGIQITDASAANEHLCSNKSDEGERNTESVSHPIIRVTSVDESRQRNSFALVILAYRTIPTIDFGKLAQMLRRVLIEQGTQTPGGVVLSMPPDNSQGPQGGNRGLKPNIVEDELNIPSNLDQIIKSSPFRSTFVQLSEDYQAMLIGRMNLDCYFPDKLTYTNVMCISNDEKDEPDTLADIPRLILRKLIMLDFTSRETDLNKCFTKMKRSRDELSVNSQESNASISKEDFFSMFDNDEDIQENDSSNEDRLSPVDVFLSIFICLHPTLKQKICLKMFACHLAIPIMFPFRRNQQQRRCLMFSMWPLRSIMVYNGHTETSLVNCKQNVVSFVRLGRPPISKSKLANEILYDTAHNAFFNYDCTLGACDKQASNGLVEAAWFLPSPKQPNDLETITLFLNLRGDAYHNAEQVEYLKSISRVMIIFTDKETMRNQKQMDYFKRPHLSVLFLLIGKVSKDFIGRYKEHYMNSSPEGFNAEFIQGSQYGKNIGMSEIKESVVNFIGPLLNCSNSSKPVQEMCMQAREMGITVDEDMIIYQKGQLAANTIFDKVKDCPLADIKGIYTPLQTTLWQNYTDAIKAYRKSGSDFQENVRLNKEMKLQRKKQWEIYKTGQHFMRGFIDKFVSLEGDSLAAFLDSLKFQFDEKSRREMPIYRKSYAAAWDKFQAESEADKNKAEHEVDNAEEKLSKASFGIEHIFREIGQIYEASLTENKNELGLKLAKAVARSIKLGFPFELMDGDVANVPLDWVACVFKELKEMLGDKKILTLSILGLQSSGKSTLLNAMFGLTFSVSAGRCTRGIYLQLFPVQTKQFKFDYVLIVDTEGLRAPELGNQKHQHDNELATLVLGMADITIVNIKGENTSEVKDILQISVHAFLRLRMAKQDLRLRQSCIFIHQNVSDVGAKDSMIHSRKKLDETLDKMTLEAAEEENIGDIKCFKDVIDFDSNHHVWYFSDLWKGDPPMAPANPGYSRDVREVKSFIFRTLIKEKESYLTISDSFCHIKDLWNGILASDFVFSFRNSLEIRAYNALEMIYQDLIWQLEQYIKDLIGSAEIEMKQYISECETDIDKSRKISQYTNKLHNEYQKKFQEKQSELKECLRNHFENSDKKEEIAKWKPSKLFAWERFAGDWVEMLKKQLTDIETHCRVDYEMNTVLEKSKNEIYDQAAALAEHMKGNKPSSPKMEAAFNEMWDKWIRKINVQEEDPVEIKVLLESIIFEAFKHHQDLVEAELNQCPLDHPSSFATLENSLNTFKFDEKYISIKSSIKGAVKKFLHLDSKNETFKKAIEFTNMILKEIDVKFSDLVKTEWKFDVTKMKTIPKRIMEHIDRHNRDKSNEYTFPEPYKVKICVHAFQYALPLLQKLDSEYRDKYSIKSKLKNHRARVWAHFKDIVDEKSATLIACDRFCEIVRDNVEEAIKSSLPKLISNNIVDDFSNSKTVLMKRIMTDLVKTNTFSKFKKYIKNPNVFAFTWLSDYIDSKCFGRSGTIYMDNVSGQLRIKIDVIKKSIKESSASNLHDLLRNVQKDISTAVWIQKAAFSIVEKQKKTDLNDFKLKVNFKLEQVRSELENKFQCETETTIKWHEGKTPHQTSMDSLWGCQAICPFCSEPCQWNDKHTSKHACIQHRQGGVAGGYWNKTDILELESCSFNVQADYLFQCSENCQGKCKDQGKSDDHWHPYKDYNDFFPEWEIHPSPEITASKYWAWVFCTFHEEIAETFNKKKASIPQSWKEITKDDAIESLTKLTN